MSKLSQVNETPIYTTILPSTGETVRYRPFLVAEERSLLTAGESEDSNTMYSSMESVVRNCLQSNVSELTTFDVEFLFVTIRSKSVGEFSEIVVTCDSCGSDTEISINLKTVELVTPENHSKKIELNKNKIVMMKYPTIDQILDINKETDRYDKLTKLLMHSVYNKDDIYIIEEETDEEVDKFIRTLTSEEYSKIKHFIDTIPYVQIKHSWKCKNPDCEKEHNTEFKGIFSFF